jgi:hypothetical protein
MVTDGAFPGKRRRPYQTRGWLNGYVDRDNFPNVHGSFTRKEAMDQPTQVIFPAYDSE